MADRFRSRSRGVKSWGTTQFGVATLTTTQLILASLVLSTTSGETILRSRGMLFLRGNPDAAGDDDVVGLGLIVVQSAAAAVGGASIPGPINDGDADWFWHQFVPLNSFGSAADDEAIGLNKYVEIDSKAMRKVPRDQTVILVGELFSGELSNVQVSGGLRLLSLQG